MGEQEDNTHYIEVLELVYREYEKSLDLDIALTVVPMDDAVRIRLIDDPDLAARIAICDAKMKQDLMTDLRGLAKTAVSEGVRMTALKELGRTIYPRRFKDGATDNSGSGPRTIRYEVLEPIAP